MIFEFTHNDVIVLEELPECIPPSDDISHCSSDNLSCEVIRFPRDMSEHSGIDSVNIFTLAMRLNLAQSIGLGAEEILPKREDHSIRRTSLRYYTSLSTKLFDKFGIEFHLCPVYGDGTVYTELYLISFLVTRGRIIFSNSP